METFAIILLIIIFAICFAIALFGLIIELLTAFVATAGFWGVLAVGGIILLLILIIKS